MNWSELSQIFSPFPPRITAENTPDPPESPLKKTIFQKRVLHVLTARGLKFAIAMGINGFGPKTVIG